MNKFAKLILCFVYFISYSNSTFQNFKIEENSDNNVKNLEWENRTLKQQNDSLENGKKILINEITKQVSREFFLKQQINEMKNKINEKEKLFFNTVNQLMQENSKNINDFNKLLNMYNNVKEKFDDLEENFDIVTEINQEFGEENKKKDFVIKTYQNFFEYVANQVNNLDDINNNINKVRETTKLFVVCQKLKEEQQK